MVFVQNKKLIAYWSTGAFAIAFVMIVLPIMFGLHSDFIEKWQTLITGILALLAAATTVWYLRKQIEQADAHEAVRLHRRFVAARAVMPLALSSICDYAEGACEALKQIYPHIHTSSPLPNPMINFPDAPSRLIDSLEKIIESTPDLPAAHRLADILGEIQILNSRVQPIFNNFSRNRHSTSQMNIETYMRQAGVIYGASSSLFTYARRETEHPENFNWANVTLALRTLSVYSHTYSQIFSYIERAIEQDKNPFS